MPYRTGGRRVKTTALYKTTEVFTQYYAFSIDKTVHLSLCFTMIVIFSAPVFITFSVLHSL